MRPVKLLFVLFIPLLKINLSHKLMLGYFEEECTAKKIFVHCVKNEYKNLSTVLARN